MEKKFTQLNGAISLFIPHCGYHKYSHLMSETEGLLVGLGHCRQMDWLLWDRSQKNCYLQE